MYEHARVLYSQLPLISIFLIVSDLGKLLPAPAQRRDFSQSMRRRKAEESTPCSLGHLVSDTKTTPKSKDL